MTKLRFTKGAVRPRRLLWTAAAGMAFAAAILPAQGAAARYRHQLRASHVRLAHHALRVRGTEANDAIALRLAAGNPAVVQVDLRDDGSADFSFPRAEIDEISVKSRGGDDRVRIDDSNGAFTDTISTTIDGGPGNDTIDTGANDDTARGGLGDDILIGGGFKDHLDGGPGDDELDGGAGPDALYGGLGNDQLDGGDDYDFGDGGPGIDTCRNFQGEKTIACEH